MPTIVTFEGPYYHKKHGLVRVRISRQVEGRTGSQLAATKQVLEVREPNFEDMWEGDLVEIFDQQDNLIDTQEG